MSRPCLAEALLGSESFGVGGEIADQVRPADLATVRDRSRGRPTSDRSRDAFEVLAEQRRRLALVAVGGDAKDGSRGVTAPQRVRFLPRNLQPVSSTLSAGAARMPRAGPRRALPAPPRRGRGSRPPCRLRALRRTAPRPARPCRDERRGCGPRASPRPLQVAGRKRRRERRPAARRESLCRTRGSGAGAGGAR